MGSDAEDGGGGGHNSAGGHILGVSASQLALGSASSSTHGTPHARPLLGRRRSQAARKVCVLSVDDDPVNQLVVDSLLSPEGYLVKKAMDGPEALQLIEDEGMPDIVLLDVMMPGMSGYEVCHILREKYPYSCVPVIMVSAKSEEHHIVEGLTAGSNDYIVKVRGEEGWD